MPLSATPEVFQAPQQTSNLLAQPTLRYMGRHLPAGLGHMDIQSEVYQDPQTKVLMVVTTCPRCGPVNKTSLRIPGELKEIRYDPKRGLFVEKWRCTWESDNKAKPSRVVPSANMCRAWFEFVGWKIVDA